MALTLTTGPAIEPVTLTEAKEHLRVDIEDDDSLILTYIAAARRNVESWLHRALINQTFTLKLDEFPSVIRLPRPPLSSVTSIQYIDDDGVEQTVSSSVYTVDTDSTPGLVYEAYDQDWPSDLRGIANQITVTYVAGFGADAADVPETIRAGILMLAADLYEHREARMDSPVAVQENPTVERLLWPERFLGEVDL